MADLLNQLSHRKGFQKQAKKTRATAPEHKKTRPNKTIQVSYDAYKKLKIASAIHNIQMGKIASESIKYCIKHNCLHDLK